MTYIDWVKYNIEAEESILSEIKINFGESSKKYKIKLKQLNDLKSRVPDLLPSNESESVANKKDTAIVEY